MSKVSEIFDALLTRFSTLAVGSPALPLAFPDIGFDPATDALDGKYIEAKPFNNTPLWEGLSAGQIRQGLFVVGVVWPKGQGVIAPTEAAEAVAEHFHRGQMLRSGSTVVKLSLEPLIGTPLSEPDKTTVPVTISWTA